MAQSRLPEDLIIETLLCLPVKSVLRFRCLSKPLKTVIDSHDFIKTHLSKSSQNFNRRKLIIQSLNTFHVCDFNFDMEENTLHLTKTFSFLRNEIYGYCNGLLLLSRNTMHQNTLGVSLWNPSTRCYMDLPDFPREILPNRTSYNVIGSGLGYDHSTDDYKAFFIVPARPKNELALGFGFGFGLGFEVEVWIYDLKSNIWRRAENFPYRVYSLGGANLRFAGLGYFADGILYCLCMTFSGIWKLEIMAFHLTKETFSLVTQPDCSIKSGGIGVSTKLHVLEGCLCITYVSTMPLQTDLYMRKKDEVGRFMWTRLFSVSNPLFLDTFTVLRYTKSGDKILIYIGMHYMISYDVKEKSFGRVEVDIDCRWNDPILCLENLMPLGGGA